MVGHLTAGLAGQHSAAFHSSLHAFQAEAALDEPGARTPTSAYTRKLQKLFNEEGSGDDDHPAAPLHPERSLAADKAAATEAVKPASFSQARQPRQTRAANWGRILEIRRRKLEVKISSLTDALLCCEGSHLTPVLPSAKKSRQLVSSLRKWHHQSLGL